MNIDVFPSRVSDMSSFTNSKEENGHRVQFLKIRSRVLIVVDSCTSVLADSHPCTCTASGRKQPRWCQWRVQETLKECGENQNARVLCLVSDGRNIIPRVHSHHWDNTTIYTCCVGHATLHLRAGYPIIYLVANRNRDDLLIHYPQLDRPEFLQNNGLWIPWIDVIESD